MCLKNHPQLESHRFSPPGSRISCFHSEFWFVSESVPGPGQDGPLEAVALGGLATLHLPANTSVILPQLQSYRTDLAERSAFLWQPSRLWASAPRRSPTAGTRSAALMPAGPGGGRSRVQSSQHSWLNRHHAGLSSAPGDIPDIGGTPRAPAGRVSPGQH